MDNDSDRETAFNPTITNTTSANTLQSTKILIILLLIHTILMLLRTNTNATKTGPGTRDGNAHSEKCEYPDRTSGDTIANTSTGCTLSETPLNTASCDILALLTSNTTTKANES